MRAVRLHQLVGQPRVEQPARHGHAVPAQRRDPAFQVVPYLGDAGVFPEWRQLGQQRRGGRALLRQRQIGGGTLPPGQRHARQRTRLGVAATGDREQGHRLLLKQSVAQLGARGGARHQDVVVLALGQHTQPARGGGTGSRRRDSSVRAVPEDALDQCVELELLEHRDDPLGVQLRSSELVGIGSHLHLAVDGGQTLGQQRLRREGLDLVALLALELIGCSHYRLHRTEALDQLLRGLLAHPGDAGDVVHGVAGQTDQVDHLLRSRHAEPLPHAGHVENLRWIAAHARQPVQKRVLADELCEVLVERDHVGVEPGRLGTPRDGPDHVVRLDAGVADDRDAHRLGHPLHVRQGVAHPLGSLLARALVVGVGVGAPSRPRCVEHHGDVGGLLVGEDLQQRVGVAEYRRRVEAVGGDQRIVHKHEVGAVHQRHAVDEIEPLRSAGSGRHPRPSLAMPVAPRAGCEAESCA